MQKIQRPIPFVILPAVLISMVLFLSSEIHAEEPMFEYGSSDSMVAKTLSPTWSFEAKKGAEWFELGPAGNIIIAEKKSIYALKPEDGTLLWKLDGIEKLTKDCFEIINGTNYAMLCTKKGLTGKGKRSSILLNTTTGDTVWNSGNYDISETFGQFYIERLNTLLIFGAPEGKTVFSLNLYSFKVEWIDANFLEGEKLELFKLVKEIKTDKSLIGGTRLVYKYGRKSIWGHHEPIWVTDTTMLLMIDRIGPFTFNPSTGSRIWSSFANENNGSGKKLKDVPSAYLGYGQPVFDSLKNVVFLAFGEQLGAFSPTDGKRLWETPEFGSIVTRIQLTQDVVIASAGGQYYGLNYETGAEDWKDELPYPAPKPGVRSLRIIYVNTGVILGGVLDKSGVGRDKYSFEELEDGYIIYSKQHVVRFDTGGNIIQHVHSDYGDRSSLTKSLLKGISGYYQDYQEGTTGVNASSKSDDFVFLPVKTLVPDKKYGVAVISKETGNPLCQIALGGKSEDYRIDGIRNVLVSADEKNNIFTCYSFDSVRD